MIKKNNQTIGAIYKGTTEIESIYKGTLLVYGSWETLTASGVPPLTLLKCKGTNLLDYKIYGATTQEGTPTLDNPIEYQSVGDLVTDSSDANYGKYKIPIKITGKNLLGFDDFEVTATSNIRSYDSLTDTYYYKSRNSSVAPTVLMGDSQFNTYGKNNVIKAGTYIFTVQWLSSFSFNNAHLYIRLDEETTDYIYTNTPTTINKDFTLKGLYVGSKTVPANTSVPYRLMLEKLENSSSTASEYEKYHAPITTNIYLNEPLRKLVNPSNVEFIDYIDFENQKVVRNTMEFVVTGDESGWSRIGSPYLYRFVLANGQIGPGAQSTFPDEFCNYAECKAVATTNSDVGASVYYSASQDVTYFRMRPPTTYSSVSAFTNVLKSLYNNGNPLKIVFPILVSTEESITLPDIPLNRGTNIVDVDTSITPSNMYVKYEGR